MTNFNYLPGDKTKKQALASIIRVNQAGEYGAKRIYEGQLSALKNHKEIKEMLNQELAHLRYFNNTMAERKVRPTLLQPIWHIGGFILGAATACMGEKAAMACTVAVEEVIGEHYNDQVKALGQYPEEQALSAKIAQFRKEELEHRDTGLEHSAEQLPGYRALTLAIKAITKTAIELSKRL